MSIKSPKRIAAPVTVDVVVVVSHDQLRTGDAGEVELTDHVRRMIDKGYLALAEDDNVTGRPLGTAPGSPAAAPAPAALLGVAPPEEVIENGREDRPDIGQG